MRRRDIDMPRGFDQETGEIWDYSTLAATQVNQWATKSRSFHVPQKYLQVGSSSSSSISTIKIGKQSLTAKTMPHPSQSQKREITLGYKTTHRLFLVPSLFLFFKFTALVLLFCELLLHIWAHKKNSRNLNTSIFYRSPLHLISSQFCATCKHDAYMIKLCAIQDKRRAKQLIELSTSVG